MDESLRRKLERFTDTYPHLPRPGEKWAMSIPLIRDRYPEVFERLGHGVSGDGVLQMIDLSPFSSHVDGWEATKIHRFLSAYYDMMARKITEKYGIIDKYIGDAIISTFGAPFKRGTTSNQEVANVLHLSMDMIDTVESKFGPELTAKVAIAYGNCFYGKIGNLAHEELTIVGNTLTTLHRLEAGCGKRCVVIPKATYDGMANELPNEVSKVDSRKWRKNEVDMPIQNLNTIKCVTFTKV